METSRPSRSSSPLIDGFRVQRRVVWALIMRELLTRYGRNNVGFLWLFIEPMAFVGAITLIWTATRGIHNSSIPIVAFALTGYSSILLWRKIPGRCIGAIESNSTLLHHRFVKVLDIFIARILLEQGAVTASFVILGMILWLAGWLLPPEDVLKVIFAWLLLAWFGAGLALTLSSLAYRWEVIAKFWSPFALILFPMSGAAFMVDAMPVKARELLLYIPMLHAVELMREGYFGSHITAHYDLSYLSIWNMALSLFGLSQTRRIGTDEIKL